MQITVNGQPRDVSAGSTITDLLRELDVAVAHVAVEVNRDLIPRAEHNEVSLAAGDELEVVTLVGGG
jgi:sulfur carrier protein